MAFKHVKLYWDAAKTRHIDQSHGIGPILIGDVHNGKIFAFNPTAWDIEVHIELNAGIHQPDVKLLRSKVLVGPGRTEVIEYTYIASAEREDEPCKLAWKFVEDYIR